jgi:hypothetical protein
MAGVLWQGTARILGHHINHLFECRKYIGLNSLDALDQKGCILLATASGLDVRL